jgi:hypothetical protein
MIAELDSVQGGGHDPLTAIEKGFRIAWCYRNQLPLRDELVSPVDYFKRWLPKFEAEIKFHELCYYAEKFGPDGPLPDQQNFLLRELGRSGRVRAETPGLYDYIGCGTTDRDEELFGGDPETAAEHALRIAGFLAFARYDRYLEARFKNLFKQQPNEPAN